MTQYTLADLAVETLKAAGVTDPTQSPDAQDQVDAELIVQSRYASLVTIGISIPNGSDTNVPIEWLSPLANYCALFLTSFGLPAPAPPQVLAAETILRKMSAKLPTGSVVSTEYF